MFKKIALLGSLVALMGSMTACGLSEDAYADGVIEKSCYLWIECFELADLELLGWDWESEQDCVDWMNDNSSDDTTTEDCTYDAGVAQECLDAYEAIECDDFTSGTYDVGVCQDVYEC